MLHIDLCRTHICSPLHAPSNIYDHRDNDKQLTQNESELTRAIGTNIGDNYSRIKKVVIAIDVTRNGNACKGIDVMNVTAR